MVLLRASRGLAGIQSVTASRDVRDGGYRGIPLAAAPP
jgi:hypothetical protein